MMQSTIDAFQDMNRTLKGGEESATSLLAALEDERDALTQQDFSRIEKGATTKSTLVDQLDAFERQRNQICQAAGFGESGQQMSEFLNAMDNKSRSLHESWNTLSTKMASCRSLNNANGAIIRVRQQHFEASLSLLRGGTVSGDTYARSGAGNVGHERRAIAEA